MGEERRMLSEQASGSSSMIVAKKDKKKSAPKKPGCIKPGSVVQGDAEQDSEFEKVSTTPTKPQTEIKY